MTRELKIKKYLILLEKKKREVQKSFHSFFLYFWDTIIQDEYIDNWHIKYLCNELQYLSEFIINKKIKPYDLIINVPPGTSKSTIVTVMFPVWLWINEPSLSILTSSYSSSLSINHSLLSRDIFLSDKFKDMFGNDIKIKKDKNNKTNWANNMGGERIITSTGGSATGRHAHIILIDDPLNPEQAVSDKERENANRFINSTLSSRKKDKEKTPTILIMQRLHEDDPTGNMLSKGKNIKHICLPAEIGNNIFPKELRNHYLDGLLDVNRLNESILTEAKKDLGIYAYAGQFEQNPAPLEGGILKRIWFEKISYEKFMYLTNNHNHINNFMLDTAFTKDTKNDPSGIISYCKIENKIYIYNAKKWRLEFPELIKILPKYCKENDYDSRSRLMIEPKANGISVVQQLKTDVDLNVMELPAPKDDKTTRTFANSAIIENGNVVIVDGVWNTEFIDEIITFPNAKHDEFIDLLNCSVEREFMQIESDIFPLEKIKRYNENLEHSIGILLTPKSLQNKYTLLLFAKKENNFYLNNLIYTESINDLKDFALKQNNINNIDYLQVETDNQSVGFYRWLKTSFRKTYMRRELIHSHRETRILSESEWILNNCYFRNDYETGSDYDNFITDLTKYMKMKRNQIDDPADSLAGFSQFIKRINKKL